MVGVFKWEGKSKRVETWMLDYTLKFHERMIGEYACTTHWSKGEEEEFKN